MSKLENALNLATETTVEDVVMDVAAITVKAGDVLFYGSGEAEVTDSRAGSSKRIIKVEGKKTEIRLDPSEVVTVRRSVETDESKARNAAIRKELAAAVFFDGLLKAGDAAREELFAHLQGNKGSWRLVEMSLACVKAEFKQGVAANWVKAVESASAEVETFAAAREAMKEQLRDELCSGTDAATWSGGHSAHNAEEQARTEARRELLNRWF